MGKDNRKTQKTVNGTPVQCRTINMGSTLQALMDVLEELGDTSIITPGIDYVFKKQWQALMQRNEISFDGTQIVIKKWG